MDFKMGDKLLSFNFSDLILPLHFRLCVHFRNFRAIYCIFWNRKFLSKLDIQMLRSYGFYFTLSKTFKLSISFAFCPDWSVYEFNI